ncbi:MAG: TonB-dependent receptor [Vicinamibacterales bacterium]
MVRVCALVLTLLMGSWSTTFAQVSSTTGSINGKVSDATGGVLPGVTVTVASVNMQGTRSDVTDAGGDYRFPAVPPGDYKITYELPGFQTIVRDGVRVGLGFTATVNVELKVASLEETVTVSGESPVVDVSSTTSSTAFGEQKLSVLPNARDFWTVLAAAPAVVVTRIDVGGSAAGTQTGYAAYDTKQDQHRPMVEGIVNTEGTNGSGFYYDYGSIDEVAIETKGHTAEMPWPGVWSNFVTKSGGNTYHGKLYADTQPKGLQQRNIDNSLTALCPGGRCGNLQPSDLNRLNHYHDLNGDIGGYAKKDKLWWYFSARDQDVKVLLPNFPVKPFETSLRNLTGKGTFALSQNNKITGFAQGGRKVQPNRLDTFVVGATAARHSSEDSTWRQQYWGHTYKAGWESVLNNKTFFEVRGGQFKYTWPNFRYSEAPEYADIGNNLVSGGNRDGWFNIPSRNQVAGSLTYFKEGWGGDHNFKVGGEWFRETFTYLRGEGVNGVVPNDIIHVLNNGAAAQVYLFQTPSKSENGLLTNGFYVQDTWKATDKLTLNLGLRFDRYTAFLPEQVGPPQGKFQPNAQTTFAEIGNLKTFNQSVPRLGLVYDLTGKGKTVLKANYAQYYWNPGTALAENVNDNNLDWYRQYAWTDRNGDLLYQAGEEGVVIASRGGAASSVLDANLKNTRTDEISAWVEHELIPGFAVQGGYVYRKIDNFKVLVNANRPLSAYNVPTTILDPGPDGRIGTTDDGPGIPGFNLSAAALAAPVKNIYTNLPGSGEYHTLEVSANKRQTGKWSLGGAFSVRWNYDQETVYFGQNLRLVLTPSTPNDLINTDGGRYDFKMYTFKINGSYELPFGIRTTPALRFQSGQPYGRTFQAGAANGINYGSQRILAEPIGTRKQDNIAVLDIRTEKLFRLKGGRLLSGFFDIYNLANSNAVQNLNWGSGSAFQVPITIIGPTIMRFGVKVDW